MLQDRLGPAGDLERLADLAHRELAECWRDHFGSPPPKGMSRRLLMWALAYETQVRASKGLSPAIRRQLSAIATGAQDPYRNAKSNSSRLPPGTRLVRDWKGTTYVVDVVENGVLWDGRRYRSLSAVAHAITGTHWNGHLFFGLSKRKACRKADMEET